MLTIPFSDFTGRSFAEIDELFARRVKARQFAKTTTTGVYGNDLEVTQHDQVEKL